MTMSLFNALTHAAADWQIARNEARTFRIIRSLPPEVQKDIGWPDAHETRARHYDVAGSWAGGK
jgi:hypothetical protein